MPAPTTNAEFVELVRKSGVVDEKRLDAYMEKLRASSSIPATPNLLAGVFVRDGMLTMFQAEQMVRHGKWRGYTIGKYKVLEQLGSGGMGTVYLCEHMLMRRRVAVKVLPKKKAEEASTEAQARLDRFYREARAVAALDHPNIVRAYDIDNADNLHFLVMEYVDGSNLQEIIKRSGPMDVTRAAHYIRQAALGLQHAHEQARLVHRDIKPGNILVDRNGIVKILDMGLARFFHDEEDDLTKKHDENVLGTADYLAPEQAIDSHGVDIRADIYSLGATFYFCLAGRTPFAEGTVAQKLIWHQTRQPKPLKTIRPDIEDGIVAILDRMMAKRPEDRYQTPDEVVEALSPWTRTSIAPPAEAEMPKLSLAAMGNPTSASPPAGEGTTVVGPRVTASVATPAPVPKPSWQVTTPPNKPPTTIRTSVPPVKPASPAPATRPSAPAARPPSPPPAPAAPPSPAAVPHAPGPSLLQAPPPAPPRPAAPQPAEEAPAWEQFASDTGDATARLDAEPDSGRRQLRLAQSLEASRQRRRLLIITGAVGPALALLTGFIIWYSLSGDDTPPRPPNNPARNPVTFYVGPEAEYTSLLVVIRKVRPGDRIVVQGDIRAEIHVDEHEPLQGVTIEADEKKPEVVWRPLLQPGRHAALLQLNNAENVTIKGFTFDGDNKAANLILLECGCKDVRLENVKLRNFAETGVRFRNCMAEKDRPVVLSNVQANSDKPPLLFEVLQAYAVLFPKNEHIIVRENCQFAGKELSRNNLNAYVTILLQNQPIAAAACSSYFLTVPNVTIPNRALKPGDNAGVQLPKPLQWAKEELLPAPLPK